MLEGKEYKEVASQESVGQDWWIGIKVSVAHHRELSSDEQRECQKLLEAFKETVISETIRLNPKSQEESLAERRHLLACFAPLVFVREIPNGYCSRYCCKHRPWFLVTTTVGTFRIGWRKSVIHVEWTDTVVQETAEVIFPAETSTKFDKVIHAWSYDKARDYISKIVGMGKL